MTHLRPAAYLPLLIFSLTSFGQVPHVLKDSGLKKLNVFIGTWRAVSVTDSAHRDKVSAVYTCRLSPNGQFLVADQIITTNGVRSNNLAIYKYNSGEDTYTLTLVGIPGVAPLTVTVTHKGDTLIYNSEYSDGGRKQYTRTLNDFLSPVKYTWKVQFSEDGINWRTNGEGVAEKMK